MPAIVAGARAGARFAWEEFFYSELPNRHARIGYQRAGRQFLSTVRHRTVGGRLSYEPGSSGAGLGPRFRQCFA
jgi:hypothetical protein